MHFILKFQKKLKTLRSRLRLDEKATDDENEDNGEFLQDIISV